jgi:hypothetical protein
MMVGDDLAGRIDDDARTQRLLGTPPVARDEVAERIVEETAQHALGGDARDVQVDHRRRCRAHRG